MSASFGVNVAEPAPRRPWTRKAAFHCPVRRPRPCLLRNPRTLLRCNSEFIVEEDGILDHGNSDASLDSDEYFYIPGRDFDKALDAMLARDEEDGIGISDDGHVEYEVDDDGDDDDDDGNTRARDTPSAQQQTQTFPLPNPGAEARRREDERKELGLDGVLPGRQPDPEEYVARSDLAQFLPGWVRQTYADGKDAWDELQRGADKYGVNRGAQAMAVHASASEEEGRMDDSGVETSDAKQRVAVANDADGKVPPARTALLDCTVQELADDYNLPVEYIIERVLEFGVTLPVYPTDFVKNRLTRSEVQAMMAWLTTFDVFEVYDSYSDRPLIEIAEDYGVPPALVNTICTGFGIFLALGMETRLTRDNEEKLIDALDSLPNVHSPLR